MNVPSPVPTLLPLTVTTPMSSVASVLPGAAASVKVTLEAAVRSPLRTISKVSGPLSVELAALPSGVTPASAVESETVAPPAVARAKRTNVDPRALPPSAPSSTKPMKNASSPRTVSASGV